MVVEEIVEDGGWVWVVGLLFAIGVIFLLYISESFNLTPESIYRFILISFVVIVVAIILKYYLWDRR